MISSTNTMRVRVNRGWLEATLMADGENWLVSVNPDPGDPGFPGKSYSPYDAHEPHFPPDYPGAADPEQLIEWMKKVWAQRIDLLLLIGSKGAGADRIKKFDPTFTSLRAAIADGDVEERVMPVTPETSGTQFSEPPDRFYVLTEQGARRAGIDTNMRV